MEWDTLSLAKFYSGQLNLAIPETKLEVYANEFLISGTDIDDLYTLANQYQPLDQFNYIEYDSEIVTLPISSLPQIKVDEPELEQAPTVEKSLVQKTAMVGNVIPQSIILRKPESNIKMDIIDSGEELKLEVKIRNHSSIIRAFVLE